MRIQLKIVLLGVAAMIIAAGIVPKVKAQPRDRFSHSSPAHKKKDCNSCHANPTANWVAARGYPDVADLPGHTACNSCHTGRQFLALCNACHTPGGTARSSPRYKFPIAAHSNEFATIFPHNVHQDIIATNIKRTDVAVAHFVNASFRAPIAADDPPQFNNCALCHKTSGALPKLMARIPATEKPLADAAADTFAPKAAFFKDNPSGHATCFACHFQGAKPIGTNCAGCHSLTKPPAGSTGIKRYSYKFDHQQKEHAVRDCMTCHVRISQNADIRTMTDADVPFIACVGCHADKISDEAGKRAASIESKQPAFQCTYCHTSAVGRFPAPPSHDKR